MIVAYVAHPLGAGPDRQANRERASRWCAWVAASGVAPVADWIVLSGFWEETPELREAGLRIDKALVERCDVVLLTGGRISPGMRIEADHAKASSVRVVDLTNLGEEPPDGYDLVACLLELR